MPQAKKRNLYIKIKGHKLSKTMIVGLAAVIFLYISSAGLVSVTCPWWLGSGDAPRHIDYVWSVYNKKLPKLEDGLQYPKFNELRGDSYKYQPAAVNPPLFYMIHAPFVGPLLARGHWQQAIAVGRAINIFIGILCIAALAWAGWLFGGKRKELFAVAVPAIGTLTYQFTSLNLNYAVDVLLILFATLSIISSYKILRHGLQTKYLVWLTVLSVLGMATKVTYIVLLGVNLLTLLIAAYFHGNQSLRNRLVKSSLIAAAILGAVIVTIGWFYYFKNYRASGNFTTSTPDDYGSTNRPYKSLGRVLTHPALWAMFYKRLAVNETLSMFISAFSIAGIASIFDKNRFKPLFKDRVMVIMVGLMIMITLGITATQIVHAVGYGGFYFRYFLPALLPISLLTCWGLLELRWTRAQLITIAVVGMGITTTYATVRGSAIKQVIPALSGVSNTFDRINISLASNNIPTIIGPLLIGLGLLGALILSYTLFKLSAEPASGRI